jgi:RNA polymerase sigma-70 factor, ECF subfamily
MMIHEPAAYTVQTALDDMYLVDALRAGDETAFAVVLDRYHAAMVRIALLYVRDRAVAEEVVQETWLGVLQGIGRFEARCSLKTWIFRILTNIAKTCGTREGRSLPFSSIWNVEMEAEEPAVDPARFGSDGHWVAPPQDWPEVHVVGIETRDQIRRVIDALPAAQRTIISLRDVAGWSASEVCSALGLSEGNQRVLLHRARSKVREALDAYLCDSTD